MTDIQDQPRPREVPKPAKRPVVDGGFLVLAGLTLLAGVLVAIQAGPGRLWAIIVETFGFIALLAPKILGGVFIAASLPLLLPREKVAEWIGRESGLRGLALAALAGAAIPGGPMMTFPLAAGFAVVGADIGAIMAFVSGWNLLSLNRTLIWEFSFLPADLVWLRVLISLPLPLLLGLSARALFGGRG